MTVTGLDQTTALIVIDLQRGLADRELAPTSLADVVAGTERLTEAFHAHNLPVVIVTVDAAPPGRTDLSGAPRTFPTGWDTAVSPFAEDPEVIRVVKQSPGVFTTTSLDEELRSRGVTQLVVVGVSTSIGVEMTAREGHELGYHVTVALDACSDSDGVRHEYSATSVLPRVAETGTVDDILTVLARRS
ncbi:isochorismatase family protein [Gordonia hydrophobica]|uniref:Isochorismatase family protein n=1 Tax=Gordonia hydrophobica TaxID=40516 RepID=A0ABZ2U4B9_9ACTN|nr:isochorismatase family protein [Gordonia hydrophobica]MBM7368353.1 nicotinamidase-related amidase [Gordonia hydrophobica]